MSIYFVKTREEFGMYQKGPIKIKVNSMRTMISPYKKKSSKDDTDYEILYYLLVNMRDLPENIPMDVNPRKPKMTTNAAKRIINAINEPEEDFWLNNRGIVISAKSLTFDTSKSEVTIDLGDKTDENDRALYGIVDGGHTYTAIIMERNSIPKDREEYVRMEVVVHVKNITRLSDGRNTSVEVSELALYNLDDKFQEIKDAIKNEPYANKIAYKDNENKPHNIDALLRLMFAFDIVKYPDDTVAPIQSYSMKSQVFKRYKAVYEMGKGSNDFDFYMKLIKELPLLVRLYDKIELEIGSKYVEYKRELGTAKPKYGGRNGVETAESGAYFKTTFLQNNSMYNTSTGYIYPIFGAFRSLINWNPKTKELTWQFSPLELWDEVGKSLVQNVFESNNGKNAQLTGKDKQLWLSNYRIVETQSLRKQAEKLMKQLRTQKK